MFLKKSMQQNTFNFIYPHEAFLSLLTLVGEKFFLQILDMRRQSGGPPKTSVSN